jgi:predicted permease
MSTLLQDLRFAVRQLIKRRGTTVLIIVILALGIGANTTVFTLINATLVRPVPAADPDRLVSLHTATASRSERNLSYPEYREFRDRVTAFDGLIASEYVSLTLGGETPERAHGLIVSGNYFDVLGVHPARGRTFLPEEDATPGAHPVVVLGYELWKRRFGGSLAVLDSAVEINGHPFTVVGIAPRGFEGIESGGDVEMWVPLAMIAVAWPAERDRLTKNETWLHVVGRLGPAATVGQATAAASQVARTLRVPASSRSGLTGAAVTRLDLGGMRAKPLHEAQAVFAMLIAITAMVLLVACANVANLLLARAIERRKELAVRLSLGASRGRLVRQLLTESLLLSFVAAGAGILLSFWLLDTLLHFAAVSAALPSTARPDALVLAFTTGLALLTGLGFGLVPALGATGLSLTPALKDDSAASPGGSHRLRNALVVAQVAVSLMLVIAAGLFVRSLDKVLTVDPGFAVRGGVAVSFDLAAEGFTPAQRAVFYRQLLDGALALPGVRSASIGSMPLSQQRAADRFEAAGAATAPEYDAMFAAVWPDYFETMGMTLLRGRDFTARDDASAPSVIIVNQMFARWMWPNGDALGKLVRMGDARQPLREVVGIVRDAKYVRLTEDGYEFAYLPERQLGSRAPGVSLVIRAAGDPAPLVPVLTRLVHDLSPRQPVFQVTTFDDVIARSAAPLRLQAQLLGLFGALVVGLAALGLYAVVTYAVNMRTREIGVRMALGAGHAHVVGLFVRQGVLLAVVGVVIGAALSAAAARGLSAALYGITPTDPIAFLAGAALLCVVAAMASYLPARRAAKVDPMVALRYE